MTPRPTAHGPRPMARPSAAKLVDGAADPRSEFGTTALLDAMESALNARALPGRLSALSVP
jgi:hypothetical protein